MNHQHKERDEKMELFCLHLWGIKVGNDKTGCVRC